MKPNLNVLIHIPRFAEYSVSEALEHLQNMVNDVFFTDSSRKSVKILESMWHLDTLYSGSALLRYSRDDITSWRADMEKYGDDIESFLGTIEIRRMITKCEMEIGMYINPEWPGINLFFRGERTIFISIPEILWRDMDIAALAERVCETACALKATYAYVDTAWFPVKSLHTSWFRVLCENGDEYDPEEKLPGVFWGQYVTQKMVEATATIDEIAAQAPCDVKKVYSEAERRGVWLQLSSKPEDASVESRQELRRYFERSLYALSAEKVKRYNNMYIKMVDFDTLPLLLEEKIMLE